MKRLLLIGLLLLFSLSLTAKELRVAVGLSIPPYVIKENNSGFEMELIRAVLKQKEHQIKNILYASNKRITKLLKNRQVDMAINLQPHLKDVYYTDVIIEFNNAAITLKSRDITIKSIFDLHYKRVESFQNAHNFLGKEFASYALNNPLYEEILHQEAQMIHLINKKIDVVIADKNIFLYYVQKNHGQTYQKEDFNFFEIFSKSPRYAGFLDAVLQKDFNEALRAFKQTKEYQLLLKKYHLK